MKTVLYTLIFSLSFSFLNAQTLSLTNFATGLDSPVSIAFPPGDDRMFVVEQDGVIQIVSPSGIVNPSPFLDIQGPVYAGGNEQGLLGLAFHPDYANNGYFYVNYTYGNFNNSSTRIARYTVSANPDVADASSEFEIMTISQPYSNHNGGAVEFGPDGYLYIGTGDGGSANDPGNRSQNGTSMLGKMLRIDVDGGSPYAIPADNPFVGDPNVNDEIWSIGLRNPWRYSFDRRNGNLWIADVGQNAWEEIDFESSLSPGGLNYGWRCYEGDHPFNTNGCGPIGDYTGPVFEYANTNSQGCSVTGGYVYRSAEYAGLYGKYLFTDFCSGKFWATDASFNTVELANLSNNSYSCFGEGPCGTLYVGNRNGIIHRVAEDDDCNPVAEILGSSTYNCDNTPFPISLEALCGENLDYQWYLDGNVLPFGTGANYPADQAGVYTVEVIRGACTVSSNTVTIMCDTVIDGLEELADLSGFNLYPNPNNASFQVEFELTKASDLEIRIHNILGAEIYTQTQKMQAGSHQLPIELNAATGVYMISLKTNEGQINRKFVINE